MMVTFNSFIPLTDCMANLTIRVLLPKFNPFFVSCCCFHSFFKTPFFPLCIRIVRNAGTTLSARLLTHKKGLNGISHNKMVFKTKRVLNRKDVNCKRRKSEVEIVVQNEAIFFRKDFLYVLISLL